MNAFQAHFDFKNFASHALGFADVLAGLVDGDAIGSAEKRGGQEDQ
jgi:hypothetical protein